MICPLIWPAMGAPTFSPILTLSIRRMVCGAEPEGRNLPDSVSLMKWACDTEQEARQLAADLTGPGAHFRLIVTRDNRRRRADEKQTYRPPAAQQADRHDPQWHHATLDVSPYRLAIIDDNGNILMPASPSPKRSGTLS